MCISLLSFKLAKNFKVSDAPPWLQSPRLPYILFLSLTLLWFVSNYSKPPYVGGDLEYQMIGYRQFLRGDVDQFNAQKVPILKGDLSQDRIEHCVWYPPGPLYILYPLNQRGLSPDLAARWMLFTAFLVGGCGFLALGRTLGFCHFTCLSFAPVLSLAAISRDGLGIISPTSADNLGFAMFPWLSLGALRLLKVLNHKSTIRAYIVPFLSLGFATGSLYIIKYSWFVAGASLAFFLGISVFLFVRKLSFGRRLVLMGGYSLCFFIPFSWLNHHNILASGGDALDYNQTGNLGENAFIDMIYGPNFSSTARPQELPFSLAAGPGFLIGGNLLATRFVHFLRQDKGFTHFFQTKLGTNAHVWALILICIPFTILSLLLFGSHFHLLESTSLIYLLTMTFLPLLLLGYLSLKSGFNYIVKDNYRYVIPYSLLSQLLLLNYTIVNHSIARFHLKKLLVGFALFWACIFPGTWALQSEIQHAGIEMKPTLEVPTKKLHDLIPVDQPSLAFFLNGHGPRRLGIMPRELHFSFLLNGGSLRGNSFHSTKTITVLVAVESNLDPNSQIIQEFLERFPGVEWTALHPEESLYPNIFIGSMNPSKEIVSS
jgi:hypothetical protein